MNIFEKINYMTGKIVVYLLLIVYTFVMHNKLNDVTLTRFFFFIIISYISFLIMCINSLAAYIIKLKKEKNGNKYSSDDILNVIKCRLKNTEKWVKLIIAFFIICVLSYVFSPYKRVALTGIGGRYIGLVFYAACVCMYCVVSKCYKFEKRDITYILCSSVIVNIWAVLNYAGIDVFNLYSDVPKAMKYSFISVLGNIDIYGMYVTLMLAISMFAFVYAEETAEKVFYSVVSLLGMMGVLASDSDMAIAGMFFSFAILIYFAVSERTRFIRYMILAVILFIAGRIMGLIYIFNPGNTRIIRSVGSIIIYKNAFIIFPLACFAAIAAACVLDNRYSLFSNKKIMDNIKKIYALCGVSIIIIVCLVSVISTAAGKGIFIISDEWGSGRGYIWKNTLNGYGNLPFVNKIFGAGEAATAWVLSDYSDIASNILNRSRVDNAHNIWLNTLVTLGIAGLAVYVLIIGLSIHNMIKYIKKADNGNKDLYMLAGTGLAVMVYSIQGAAELLEVITFPMFFCLIAMLNSGIRRYEKVK